MKVTFAIVLFYNTEGRELFFVSVHFIMYFVGFDRFQILPFPWQQTSDLAEPNTLLFISKPDEACS